MTSQATADRGRAFARSEIFFQRANAGLGSLTSDTALAEISRRHSFDMKVRDYFSYENPDGLDPFERMEDAGYTLTCAGENIIYSAKYDLSVSPDTVGKHLVDTWMTSTGRISCGRSSLPSVWE